MMEKVKGIKDNNKNFIILPAGGTLFVPIKRADF